MVCAAVPKGEEKPLARSFLSGGAAAGIGAVRRHFADLGEPVGARRACSGRGCVFCGGLAVPVRADYPFADFRHSADSQGGLFSFASAFARVWGVLYCISGGLAHAERYEKE